MLAPPLRGQSLALGRAHREVELVVGPQRRVLGERHGVVRPRAVDGRARQQHHVRGTDSPGGVEQRPRLLEPAVEVDDGVDALDAALQVGTEQLVAIEGDDPFD